MQTFKDREAVNRHIEACGTGIRSGHTPVSDEFIDEMMGCVPPEFMGTRGEFYYFQVGEISDYRTIKPSNECVPCYETYVIVHKQSELSKAYKEKQWYFIGLKPSKNYD